MGRIIRVRLKLGQASPGAKGFSLVELAAVLAIIGVLMGIAFPSFSTFMENTRRNDGFTFLLEIMHRQERYFSQKLTYTSDLTDLSYSTATNITSDNGYYKVTAATCGTSILLTQCVRLTATPTGLQAGSETLSIDSNGEKLPAKVWP